MELWIALLFAAALVALMTYAYKHLFAPGFAIKGGHVLITGGSEGLGLAVAKLCVKKGAHVTIISRSQSKLDAAVIELRGLAQDWQKISCAAVDVSDFKSLNEAVKKAADSTGGVLNCVMAVAGYARPGWFEDTDIEVFRKQMDVNFFGCVHLARASYPFLRRTEQGSGPWLVLVSSSITFAPMPGYTAYSASKCAVKGFADSLRSEAKALGIGVHVFHPANIATAGWDEENKTKPKATRVLEGKATLVTPEECAESLLTGLSLGQYCWTNDWLCHLFHINSNQLAPRSNYLAELLLWPISEIITQVAVIVTNVITKKYRKADQ